MAGFFNYSKAGKGINKEDLDKSGLALYFDIFGRRIWKLISLNILYLLVSIPAIAVTGAISVYLLTYLLSIIGINVGEISDIIKIILVFAVAILFQLFGSGPATAAVNYILRRYVKDSHVWIFSDFFEHIKKNFKQGVAVYLINTLAWMALIVAYIFYSFILGGSIGEVMAFLMIVIAAIFVMMQMYTYQLMAGFNFKIKDIYKNALLLTMIKLPWNILTFATTAVLMYAMYSISFTSPFLGVIIYGAIFVVLIRYTQIFMTNNIIKEYVLEPSLQKEKDN